MMLDELQEGDTILATEVSRLSRSTKQFIELLELVKEKGLRLVVGSLTIDCRTNGKMDIMTEMTLKIMSVFSELEKQMISERVKSGMENARAKGKTLGRPATTADDIPSKFMETYKLHSAGKLNVTDLSRLNGMSRTTVYKYISLIEEQLKN
ncbi:DNA-invertase hin [Andreesenia angusta]|uniref:DNA-invertase hin n=1 Tax=Andreesenia angusta TaxID=39480 RepID=A0A1S1VAD5_9FIRM|nr:DNA-invertase hin [Andreesenia angusta]